MPRDVSGNYTLPGGNPVVTNTIISSVWANTTMSDVATAMTNSLDRTGTSAGMTGQFKAAPGTAGGPGISFGLEPTSGLYRNAAGDFRFSIAGTDVFFFSTTGTFFYMTSGTVAAPGMAFSAEHGTGIYRAGAGLFDIAILGVKVLELAAASAIFAQPLTVPVGAVGAPSVNFATDLTTGIYQIGAANLGISLAGVKVADLAANTVGLFGGSVTSQVNFNVTNTNTVDGNDARITVNAGATGLALFSANVNRSTAIVTGGPTGPQMVVRGLGAIPLVFGVNNTFVAQFSGSTGLLQIVDATGGTAYDVGYRDAPPNLQNANYTLVMTDRGKSISHSSGAAHTWTIPANGTTAFPVGTTILLINQSGAAAITLAITTDTLVWAPSGTTGSRTLTGPAMATLHKHTSNVWMISGVGIS